MKPIISGLIYLKSQFIPVLFGFVPVLIILFLTRNWWYYGTPTTKQTWTLIGLCLAGFFGGIMLMQLFI